MNSLSPYAKILQLTDLLERVETAVNHREFDEELNSNQLKDGSLLSEYFHTIDTIIADKYGFISELTTDAAKPYLSNLADWHNRLRKIQDKIKYDPDGHGFVTMRVAANFLGVSPDRLDELEEEGLLHFLFVNGEQSYDIKELKAVAHNLYQKSITHPNEVSIPLSVAFIEKNNELIDIILALGSYLHQSRQLSHPTAAARQQPAEQTPFATFKQVEGLVHVAFSMSEQVENNHFDFGLLPVILSELNKVYFDGLLSKLTDKNDIPMLKQWFDNSRVIEELDFVLNYFETTTGISLEASLEPIEAAFGQDYLKIASCYYDLCKLRGILHNALSFLNMATTTPPPRNNTHTSPAQYKKTNEGMPGSDTEKKKRRLKFNGILNESQAEALCIKLRSEQYIDNKTSSNCFLFQFGLKGIKDLNTEEPTKVNWAKGLNELRYFLETLFSSFSKDTDKIWVTAADCFTIKGKEVDAHNLQTSHYPNNKKQQKIDAIINIIKPTSKPIS